MPGAAVTDFAICPAKAKILPMPLFTYSLARHRPELFKRCQLPTASPVPVSYEGKLLCEVSIPETGLIEMELPPELIDRIRSGKVMVMIDNASMLPHHEFDDFQIVRITEIEIYDRD